MRLPKFEYFEPKTLEAALNLLTQNGNNAHLLAGGTDVLVKMRNGRLKPKAVIGLQGIEDLMGFILTPARGSTIGATAKLAEVASNPDVLKHYPALAQARRVMANVQVRNMGTIAGNLCNAAPSAENAPPLMAMGAEVAVANLQGDRRIALDQFFRGSGTHCYGARRDHDFHLCPFSRPKIRSLLQTCIGPMRSGYRRSMRERLGCA